MQFKSFIVGLLFGFAILCGLFASLQNAIAEELPHDGYIVGFTSAAVDRVANKIASRIGKADARAVALRTIARGAGLKPTAVMARVNAVAVSDGLKALTTKMSRSKMASDVAYIEPNYIVTVGAVANDPSNGALWGMTNIRAAAAWDTKTDSSDIVVGVVDTGVDYTHPDLASNMWHNSHEVAGDGIDNDHNGFVDDIYGVDFANYDANPADDNGHGTHCSGTIGAVGNNGVGVAGVNWSVKLMGLKFLGANGSGSIAGATQAVLYAVDQKIAGVNVRVLSNSWGGGGYSQALADAITLAGQNGIIFVAAAGNSGIDVDSAPNYPSSYTHSHIVAVAAIDSGDGRAGFSNYGQNGVDLGAPGVGILSTWPGGGYASLSGTSMATPHVSGAAAMLFSLAPTLTPLQVKDALLGNSRPIGALSGITVSGGTLDLKGSVDAVDATPPPVTRTISGSVKVGAVGIAGVTISLGALGSAITDANGAWSVNGLSNGASVVATPSKMGWTFTPASRSLVLNADTAGVDFSGVQGKFSYAGVVVDGANVAKIRNAALAVYSGARLLATGVTGSKGTFKFSNLPAGDPLTLIVAHPSYNFNSSPYNFRLDSNVVDKQIIGELKRHTVRVNVVDRYNNPVDAYVFDATLGSKRTYAPGYVTFAKIPNGTRIKVALYNLKGQRMLLDSYRYVTGDLTLTFKIR